MLSQSIGAAIAHEIRTPLAGIRAAAQLLSLETGEEHTLASLIMEEVDRLARMVSTYSRSEERAARAESVDVRALVARNCAMLAAIFPDVTFEVAPSPGPAIAWVDPDHLAQALLNILKNAAEAAMAGSGARLVSAAVSLDAGPAGRQVAVLIRDDGPGVPDSLLPSLFRPYVTTKSGGTGLGLCVSRELLALNAGSLTLRSRPGETDFVITLPSAPPPTRATASRRTVRPRET